MVITFNISTNVLKASNNAGLESNDSIIHEDSEFPLRGTFYYAWYPNNWDPNGYYDNNDREVINNHITELEYANIDVAIASWWGLDNDNRIPRDSAIKKCMEETDKRTKNGETDLKWAIYYELEAFYNEPLEVMREDLDYLMKIYGGYRDAKKQPSSWHQYGPSTRVHRVEDSSRKLVSYNISPGFKHADPNKTTFSERASETLWKDLVKEMVASEVNWNLMIVSPF